MSALLPTLLPVEWGGARSAGVAERWPLESTSAERLSLVDKVGLCRSRLQRWSEDAPLAVWCARASSSRDAACGRAIACSINPQLPRSCPKALRCCSPTFALSSRPDEDALPQRSTRSSSRPTGRFGERIVREEQGGATRASYGEQTLARLGRTLEPEFGGASGCAHSS